MKIRLMIAAGAILVGAGYQLFAPGAPDMDQISFRVKGDTAYGFGTTNSKSYKIVRQFVYDNPDVRHIVLQEMPGTQDADTNLRIARLIRDRGFSTHINRNSYIASGAVDLFLAGKKRTMDCGAAIGVHSWQSILGYSPADVKYDERKKVQERFLRDMGITPSFYEFTRDASPPESVYVLTLSDIRKFDLLTEYPDCDDENFYGGQVVGD